METFYKCNPLFLYEECFGHQVSKLTFNKPLFLKNDYQIKNRNFLNDRAQVMCLVLQNHVKLNLPEYIKLKN